MAPSPSGAPNGAKTATDPAMPPAPESGTKAAGNESLAPQQTRIMGRTSYLLAWFGGCVSIGTFTMGSSVVAVSTSSRRPWPSPSAAS